MRRLTPEAALQTASGIYFQLLEPRVEDVSILDIARALSQINRYTGHTRVAYSVAEHSVRASKLVDPQYALIALLHDAHEAYVGDVSHPLKALLPTYREIEAGVQLVVLEAFGLAAWIPAQVKWADRYMLAWERRDLLIEQATPWAATADIEIKYAPRLEPWSADETMEKFLARFHELTGADAWSPELTNEPATASKEAA